MTENMIGQVVAFDQIPNDPIKFFGTPKQMLLEVPTLVYICPSKKAHETLVVPSTFPKMLGD